MRIVSWNVNGLRACARKGFLAFLENACADVVALQEVRARPEQLAPEVRQPESWETRFVAAERKGYSGVGVYARRAPDRVEHRLGCERLDAEGRLLIARFGRLSVINGYFPKGSGPERDNSRVPYKLAFYQAVFERAQHLRRYGPTLVVGDFNTAHREIDLARPKNNVRSSGFLPEERAEIDRWLAHGWIDVFRRQHPQEPGHYTWWRQWGGARERNVGWRIDNILASPGAAKRVRDSFIWPTIQGSDHCPLGVDLA